MDRLGLDMLSMFMSVDLVGNLDTIARLVMSKKVTSPKVASKASSNLRSAGAGKATKTASGSALSQTAAPKKQTSPSAASAASKVLRDGRTSAKSKSAAASALAQAPKKKR